ncbi:glycerol-3-phosphate dehydrogenase [Sphingomonas sp. CGMCC 1.13654]|uniref:Glycerol-3-phosphate dehydrogenase n=1 Tax=Sphingomonas chungangi TaxID=2683589 RepID=A0A838L4J0_9SPHN|nr:glycerol-3-phosphate dehydrogenase [Sphingomonas chungangi]MBA2934074.1 glycerol-3-phosphate dehydrogenase [Sphingomonas chungangi]MVW57115.1 glycerol-3-phosphate dehydrogenase [Sphingomonas chungangi]
MDCDLLIIGGGVNGCGIARDAAGRGLKVLLVEQDDLAGHTSSASTKLIHGGLRYLEYYEFRLVREALIEREKLLHIAPHIIWPLRFVMPMPPTGRPGWMIRLGLFLYDHLGGRGSLPGSRGVPLNGPFGAGIKPDIARGFAYSDCWVEDSRLVVLNALDARERGADIRTRTRFTGAARDAEGWIATIAGEDGERTVRARAIVNAAGPWVDHVVGAARGAHPERPPRLVKGSHIIVPRLFDGEHAYILQNLDKRIAFAIPYERDFTLIGTTDVPWHDDPAAPAISVEETAYLCASVSRYFAKPVNPEDVVHSYSGVRPLFDDGSTSASAVTRDYVLKLGEENGPQILSVFGGKITTYRRLAEHALEKLAPFLPPMGEPWTDREPLPGGDVGDFELLLSEIRRRWPFLSERTSWRLARAYGSRVNRVLRDATSLAELGEDLGGGLHTREVDYLVTQEWARTADDILWRRSKLLLHVPPGTRERLERYLAR